jgi:cobalt/nickel transport system permease protein
MSHIHIPDGILSWWIWVPALLLVVGILYFIFKSWNQEEARRLIPLAAMMSALMLITMSVPLFIVPVHLTLAVLAGLMVGPKMAFVSILVVNTMLASLGHGGVTLIGLNTLVIGAEMLVGVYVYRLVSKKLSTLPSAMIATVVGVSLSLFVSLGLMISTVGLVEALPHEEHDESDEEGIVLVIPERFNVTLEPIYHVEEIVIIDDRENFYKVKLTSDERHATVDEVVESLIEAGWLPSDNSDDHKGWYLKDNIEIHIHALHEDRVTVFLEFEILPEGVEHDHSHSDYEGKEYDEDLDSILSEFNYLGFSGWLAVIMIYLAGMLLESSATGLIFKSLKKVKKDQ